MDVQRAVTDLVLALTPVDERYAEIHYHLTDGQELTITATLHDLDMHLRGEIEELEGTAPGEFQVDRITDDTFGTESISLSGFGSTRRFRVRACTDPTCETALIDHWL